MTRWYLDTSVALHALLPWGDDRAGTWLDAAGAAEGELFSSTLLELEVLRALRREGLDPPLARILLDRLDMVSVDDGILRSAAAIEPHVKSLDAIHLATCLLLGPEVIVATHDTNMGEVATLLGLDTVDPLASAT